MEVVYARDEEYKSCDKGILGIVGDITYLDNYLDLDGVAYKDSWTVKRLLNGVRIGNNPRLIGIFNYLDIDMKYLNYKIGELSHTVFKYIMLAYLLLNNKRFIIFDNFDVGLTYKEQKKFINISRKLKEDNFKVIIITNNIVLLSKVADEINIIHDDDLVFEGTAEDLLKKKKYIKDVSIIDFILSANENKAKLDLTFDRNELIKNIRESLS